MWIGSLPLAQIELFTRRGLGGREGGRLLVVEKSRLVLMGRFAIQRSLISRRMKEVFLVELLVFVRQLLLWTSTRYSRHLRLKGSTAGDEHRLCLARLTFCHSLICLNYPLFLYFPLPFSFSLCACDECALWWNFHFTPLALNKLLSPSFSRDERVNFPRSCVYFFFLFFFFPSFFIRLVLNGHWRS